MQVWDVATGDLVHEIPFGYEQIQGVAFLDDNRLAVVLAGGNLLTSAGNSTHAPPGRGQPCSSRAT